MAGIWARGRRSESETSFPGAHQAKAVSTAHKKISTKTCVFFICATSSEPEIQEGAEGAIHQISGAHQQQGCQHKQFQHRPCLGFGNAPRRQRPFIPDVKGSEFGLTNKDILKLDEVPEKLNIIGGGIIACEIANIYSTLGSEVNILARSTFLKSLSAETKRYVLEKIIPNINIYENTDIEEVFKDKVLTANGEELEGTPFFATGRTPNSEIVEDIVELNNDKTIKVNEMMRTDVENIYAAGDVTGGYQLTPVMHCRTPDRQCCRARPTDQ